LIRKGCSLLAIGQRVAGLVERQMGMAKCEQHLHLAATVAQIRRQGPRFPVSRYSAAGLAGALEIPGKTEQCSTCHLPIVHRTARSHQSFEGIFRRVRCARGARIAGLIGNRSCAPERCGFPPRVIALLRQLERAPVGVYRLFRFIE